MGEPAGTPRLSPEDRNALQTLGHPALPTCLLPLCHPPPPEAPKAAWSKHPTSSEQGFPLHDCHLLCPPGGSHISSSGTCSQRLNVHPSSPRPFLNSYAPNRLCSHCPDQPAFWKYMCLSGYTCEFQGLSWGFSGKDPPCNAGALVQTQAWGDPRSLCATAPAPVPRSLGTTTTEAQTL